MFIDLSPFWTESDGNVYMMTNFTDVRMSINITDNDNVKVMNETYTLKEDADLISGDNVIYNATDVREFHFVMNAKEPEMR